MPNIRRAVSLGDHIFVLSGRKEGFKQYIVGGFEVDEKISALAAFERFPGNRLHVRPDSTVGGNVIVDQAGSHSTLDYHANFEKRIENYIVGRKPIYLESEASIASARELTPEFLSDLLKKEGARPSEILGRWRKLDEPQVNQLRDWLTSLRSL